MFVQTCAKRSHLREVFGRRERGGNSSRRDFLIRVKELVAAVLLSVIAASDPETAKLFGSMIDRGPNAIAALAPAREAVSRSEIGEHSAPPS